MTKIYNDIDKLSNDVFSGKFKAGDTLKITPNLYVNLCHLYEWNNPNKRPATCLGLPYEVVNNI